MVPHSRQNLTIAGSSLPTRARQGITNDGGSAGTATSTRTTFGVAETVLIGEAGLGTGHLLRGAGLGAHDLSCTGDRQVSGGLHPVPTLGAPRGKARWRQRWKLPGIPAPSF